MPTLRLTVLSVPLKKKKRRSGHSDPLCISAVLAAARRYSRFAVEAGYIPIAPHLLFPQFLDDNKPKERELGLFFGNAVLSKCAEMWVFGEHISEGMEAEIKRATWKGYRIRYFSETCKEVSR